MPNKTNIISMSHLNQGAFKFSVSIIIKVIISRTYIGCVNITHSHFCSIIVNVYLVYTKY